MKPWLPLSACLLSLVGGVIAGRASVSQRVAHENPTTCETASARSQSPPGRARPTTVLPRRRVTAGSLTPWQSLVSEEPRASMLIEQAIQKRMADMGWAQAIHDCTRSLPGGRSKVRFAATIENRSGAMTIVRWTAYVVDGPDVPEDVLSCVKPGLPSGPLELGEPWPGVATSLAFELDMELEGRAPSP